MDPDRPLRLPERFRFGVATSGFQVEGGYNGRGEPANNWAEWERAAVIEPSGDALGFWDSYEEHFDSAAALGCDSFRLSVEWSRVEPRPGDLDGGAVDGYRAILAAAARRGLEPVVTLHHFTHPAWLGADFWLGLDSPELFAAWVEVAVSRLKDHCRHWITLNEPNVGAIQSYLTGGFPPGRRLAAGAALRALDHMLAAHVLAAEVIHRLQPEARVSVPTYSLPIYELDQMLVDTLLAPHHGVARGDIGSHLRACRAAWSRSAPPAAASVPARALRRLVATAVPLEQALVRSIAELYRSARPTSIDAVALGYHDQPLSRRLRPPWARRSEPSILAATCSRRAALGLPVEVAENGMCQRVVRGRPLPRGDGWDRPRYLRESLAAVVRAVDDGAAVSGYWHRSLADSFEWGSYEPRFGLYGVDRARGRRWSALDAAGHDAAGAYRRLIAGIRSGDRSVLAGAAT
ncbi:MAG: family 1 glycosylhydrolase [Actinobacteria bacterium]|nr:family 1 glycosylhydrolase [Actinomycetota bacterium]MBW3651855.1 family 1 glycosylhydrolase [Actinomycetota bacterium]